MILRALRASLAYRTGKVRLSYPPLLVSFEPTNYCNLRCPMCPVGHHAKDPRVARGFMSRAVFDRLLPQLAEFKPVIAFHMGGESLLHPDFFEMGRRLRDAGMTVRLDSNAMLIGEEIATRLVAERPIDELYLDMDGEDRASYEAIRRRASFDRFVRNTRRLLAIRAAHGGGPKIIVKNIRHYREGARAGFPDHYKAMLSAHPPDQYRFAWADYWPGSHRGDVMETAPERRYAAPPAEGRPSRCELLWTRMAISWDGAALLCCLDLNREDVVARVTDVGIMGAWNSARMLDARRAHVEGRQDELALCGTCLQIRRPAPQARRPAALLGTSRNAAQGGESCS